MTMGEGKNNMALESCNIRHRFFLQTYLTSQSFPFFW